MSNFSQSSCYKDSNLIKKKWGSNKGKDKKSNKGKAKNKKCYYYG